MSDEMLHDESECAAITVTQENYVLLEELASAQDQIVEHYLAIALRAGCVAVGCYLTNSAMGRETHLITVEEIPENPDDEIDKNIYLVKPMNPQELGVPDLGDTTVLDDDDPVLWAFLESDIAEGTCEQVVDLFSYDVEKLQMYSQALGMSEIDFVNWCICYRVLLDREKALGRQLLLSAEEDDAYYVLDHSWDDGEFDEDDDE